MLTGCMGRNGGGWAHYVGQEKCRPITGWISLANALDWSRPPRTMIGTAYWYMHTDQWRFDGYRADALASPLADGHLAGMHTADTIAQSARLGWMPFYPQFDRNPLDLADEADAAVADGRASDAGAYVAEQLHGRQPAVRDRGRRRPGELAAHPGAVAGQPARLVGQGQRVLPQAPARHPLQRAWRRSAAGRRGRATCAWHDEAPEGKLDLLVSADFRMTSTTLLSDVVLPAATWYEKHDLSSDRHAPVRARLHPGDRPAVGGAAATSTPSTRSPAAFSDLAADAPRRPQGPGERARCSTTPRARPRSPAAWCATGSATACRRCPAGRCRCFRSSSATTPRSPTSWPRSARSPTRSASPSRT